MIPWLLDLICASFSGEPNSGCWCILGSVLRHIGNSIWWIPQWFIAFTRRNWVLLAWNVAAALGLTEMTLPWPCTTHPQSHSISMDRSAFHLFYCRKWGNRWYPAQPHERHRPERKLKLCLTHWLMIRALANRRTATSEPTSMVWTVNTLSLRQCRIVGDQ